MEGKPSGGVYLISPLVNFAPEARTAAIGVLFLGSPIPKLMTASPRSRNKRASSFSANVGDSAISLASLLSFIDSPYAKHDVAATLQGHRSTLPIQASRPRGYVSKCAKIKSGQSSSSLTRYTDLTARNGTDNWAVS